MCLVEVVEVMLVEGMERVVEQQGGGLENMEGVVAQVEGTDSRQVHQQQAAQGQPHTTGTNNNNNNNNMSHTSTDRFSWVFYSICIFHMLVVFYL